jgi:hypothetical protein
MVTESQLLSTKTDQKRGEHVRLVSFSVSMEIVYNFQFPDLWAICVTSKAQNFL